MFDQIFKLLLVMIIFVLLSFYSMGCENRTEFDACVEYCEKNFISQRGDPRFSGSYESNMNKMGDRCIGICAPRKR